MESGKPERFTAIPGKDRKTYVAVKLESDASELLRKTSYALTGKYRRRVTISDTVRILCALVDKDNDT